MSKHLTVTYAVFMTNNTSNRKPSGFMIGKSPFLTGEEEIRLGRKVQAMEQLRSCSETKARLSPVEVSNVLRDGKRAKQRMVAANISRVVAIARKYQHRGLPLSDLIQEGSLGLIRGIEKFDPGKGYRLSTYCWYWIREAITSAIAEQSRTIRLPDHINQTLNKIKKTQRELSQQLGRTPRLDEVAAAMEVEVDQLHILRNYAQKSTSLNLRVGTEKDTELMEFLEAETPSPEDYLEQKILRDTVSQLLGKLSPQCRQVLILRFGLDGKDPLSCEEIGRELNLSKGRVRQIEQKGLRVLYREQGYLAQI